MKTFVAFVAIGAALLLAASPADAKTVKGAKTIRDCATYCPEMVTLPKGSFTMGSPDSEEGRFGDEGPAHDVTIGYALAVGKYQVTRDEYSEFVSETQRADPAACQTLDANGKWVTSTVANWHNPGFAQTGRDPAVCISWQDASDYAAWLTQKTGHTYRLLSEAEFEYAARAGTKGPRYIGKTDAQLCKYYSLGELDYHAAHPGDTEIDTACHDGYAYTSPGGKFPPNAFGLYDMLGNALQWTSDCWNQSYAGVPADGSSWQAGDCTKRVWRGGCWLDDGKYLRAAYRNGEAADSRWTHSGFRVARTG